VYSDYKLSEPIELGAYGTFTPPSEGHLFLRCRDAWGALADNQGKINFLIRPRQDNGSPLADPRTN
jgi:hypothetical protein